MAERTSRRTQHLPARFTLVMVPNPVREKAGVQGLGSHVAQDGMGLFREAGLEAGQLVGVAPSNRPECAVRAHSICDGSPHADKNCCAGLE
jgi:hypothetical protein